MTQHNPKRPGGSIALSSTLALQTVVEAIVPSPADYDLHLSFAPTKVLLSRLREGERPDVVLLTKEGIQQLASQGILDGFIRDIANSSVGLAQAKGAPLVDISSPAKLRKVLIEAKSIAYSATGASGLFFAELIQRLGIEDLVKRKAVISPAGFTGEFVASGEAEVAIQQLSELHAVSGVGTITPFPCGAQCVTVFSAASVAASANPRAFEIVVSALTSDTGRSRLRQVGLEPLESC